MKMITRYGYPFLRRRILTDGQTNRQTSRQTSHKVMIQCFRYFSLIYVTLKTKSRKFVGVNSILHWNNEASTRWILTINQNSIKRIFFYQIPSQYTGNNIYHVCWKFTKKVVIVVHHQMDMFLDLKLGYLLKNLAIEQKAKRRL